MGWTLSADEKNKPTASKRYEAHERRCNEADFAHVLSLSERNMGKDMISQEFAQVERLGWLYQQKTEFGELRGAQESGPMPLDRTQPSLDVEISSRTGEG